VTLYLLDPAGGRYPITTFAAETEIFRGAVQPKEPPTLVDWSGEGRRALFEAYDYGNTTETLTEVDLATGAKRTFSVNGQVESRYSRPAGHAILLARTNNGGSAPPATLERVDLSGARQLTFPTDQLATAGTFNGGYLESADGTQLVLGAANAMVVMGNDGSVDRQLPMPAPLTDCSPVRWWSAATILARCQDTTFDGKSQLWEVPVAGGTPTALTALNTGQEDPAFGQDLGDTDAWQLPSGTFLQSEGACGTIFLSRLTPDMHTTRVNVPGVDDGRSVRVTGVTADKLVLQASLGCGPGISVLTYDPGANTSTVLLGPPVNGGGVIDAILYPSP
jgi:TolB protein